MRNNLFLMTKERDLSIVCRILKNDSFHPYKPFTARFTPLRPDFMRW